MTVPYHDKVIEANASVSAKTANASVSAKTADGELGPYGDSSADRSWWRDAAVRFIRDASGSLIRVRVP